jgi:CheY-like chemotaxis protein
MTRAHRPRVLVIDDDPGVRKVISSLLMSVGYDCQTATDGWSGLVRFDEGGWDLVLTDLEMPEVSGWDVVEAIRHRAPTMPILLIRRAEHRTACAVARPARNAGLHSSALIARPSTVGGGTRGQSVSQVRRGRVARKSWPVA